MCEHNESIQEAGFNASLRASIRNARHTPGPWMAEPADMFGDHNIILADHSEDARAIAAVVSNIRDPHEVAANAALVAAAPIMLATLEKYADQLCEGWCEQSPDCANFDDCGGCEARRIAWKAKGENQ